MVPEASPSTLQRIFGSWVPSTEAVKVVDSPAFTVMLLGDTVTGPVPGVDGGGVGLSPHATSAPSSSGTMSLVNVFMSYRPNWLTKRVTSESSTEPLASRSAVVVEETRVPQAWARRAMSSPSTTRSPLRSAV